MEEKRSRLKYQSRKRGTLENGLLLSNFAHEHLPTMNEDELNEYDKIINSLHNEWDLYYWLTNTVPIPEEIQSLAVMQKMKKYCMNEQRLSRITQPWTASSSIDRTGGWLVGSSFSNHKVSFLRLKQTLQSDSISLFNF